MLKRYSYRKILETVIVVSVLLLVFFYDTFNDYIGFYDELIALFSIIIILTVSLFNQKIKLFKSEIYISILLLVIALLGIISNFHSYKLGHFTNKIALIGDFINFFKAFAAYFGIRFLSNNINSERVLNKLSKYSKIGFGVLLIFLIIDISFKIFPQYSRYGIKSYQLFFTHPSRFSFVFSFIFLVLFPKNFQNRKWFLLFVLSFGLLSLRVKFFAFYLIAILIIFYGKELMRIPRKTLLIVLGFFLVIIALIFRDQLVMYFSVDSGWSRSVILVNSIKIGNDFFPFGTGFGTYSSFFSGKYYSWVYEYYGIDHVYGISKSYWGFITDQFWPMVLGQFGYLGLFAFMMIIYEYIMLFVIYLKRSLNLKQKNLMYVSILGMLLLLIDSSSDAIFTQNRAVVMFMLFGLLINSYKSYNETV
jgi:hypothetical protein